MHQHGDEESSEWDCVPSELLSHLATTSQECQMDLMGHLPMLGMTHTVIHALIMQQHGNFGISVLISL